MKPRKFLLFVRAPMVAMVLLMITFIVVGVVVKSPPEHDLFTKLQGAKDRNDLNEIEHYYYCLTRQYPTNIDLQYEYIQAHYNLPEPYAVRDGIVQHRPDAGIINYFNDLSGDTIACYSDIGYFGLGMIAQKNNDCKTALNYFAKVRNRNMKYLNNEIGKCYYYYDLCDVAETCYRKEIALKGNVEAANLNLINLFFYQKRYSELQELAKDPQMIKYFESHDRRFIAYKTHDVLLYFRGIFESYYDNLILKNLLVVLLIGFVYIVYFRKLDVFEPEKNRYIFICLLISMVATFLCFPFYDFYDFVLNFRLNGHSLNDFFYCFISIGLIEEMVKIIPFLIFLYGFRLMNEPYDYILYAAVSALGFSMVENLIYFKDAEYGIIYGRAFVSTVSHVFNTSVIAYGMLINDYKWKKNKVLIFIAFLLIAALAHGLFDFLVFNESLGLPVLIPYFFLTVSFLATFINNALNNSAFFNPEKAVNGWRYVEYLMYSLSCIFLVEVIYYAATRGPNYTGNMLSQSIHQGSFLIVFLALNLGNITLVRGKWKMLSLKAGYEPEAKSGYDVIGEQYKIVAISHYELLHYILPCSGKIVSEVVVPLPGQWYIFEAEKPFEIKGYRKNIFLVCAKNTDDELIPGDEVIVKVCLIKDYGQEVPSVLTKADISFIGWAKIS